MGNHVSCMYSSPVACNNIERSCRRRAATPALISCQTAIAGTCTTSTTFMPAAPQANNHSSTVTILSASTASISELPTPLTAAEVMMEHPGHFITCYNRPVVSASTVRHLCAAVPADYSLRAAELYLLLPMHKLNTRLSEQETAFLGAVIDSRSSSTVQKSSVEEEDDDDDVPAAVVRRKFYRRSNSGNFLSKVAPLPPARDPSSDQFEGSKYTHTESDSDDDNEIPASLLQAPASLCRQEGSIRRSKSWTPKLETISEQSGLS